ncbi:hypothetical protein PN499_29185 [Kamptonema animale CS-326]|jgi:hypothetical protein|uniref:hypothetical protein n=1 Tax=Kamptonema animale TaxID=92934 RepID=UPI00232CC08A|nr:hypothetical protein [Kamptonema animale]MDB9515280.1 hypothetical protein [Kamptonema animale CS-326]
MKLQLLILATGVIFLGVIPHLLLTTAFSASLAESTAITQARFQRHQVYNEFSFESPSNWIVTTPSRDDMTRGAAVMIANFSLSSSGHGSLLPAQLKTDIYLLSSSFETNVNQAVSLNNSGIGTIVKKESLKINGREALRLWGTDAMEGLPVLTTFIRHTNNRTIRIDSYYSANNVEGIHLLETFHNSLKFPQ